MSETIDCRGSACPIPVLKTKEAIEKGTFQTVTVIVDNKASRENVKRFAEKAGCSVKVTEKDGTFYLDITKGKATKEKPKTLEKAKNVKGYTVLMASTHVGEDKGLGEILAKGFIKTFLNADPMPSKIILINTAVRFACKGADKEILSALKELNQRGVEILCCGTCLNYFNILDDLEIGIASNAYEVVQALANSDMVVRL